MAIEPPPHARRRLGVGAAITLVIAALAVTVAIGVLRGSAAPATAVPLATATPTGPAPVGELFVHVSGAVTAPGLYRLDDGARVVDAISAAGGFDPDADRGGVNLARPLSDGEQLVVPVVGAAPVAAATPSSGAVNLNTADQATLETLPRIGPALAQRIIAWRGDNGAFTTVDDLLAVPGIGDAMLETLRDLVTV